MMKNSGFVCLTIAAAGDLIIPFLLAPFAPHYQHKTMVLSALGNPSSPVHGIYNVWLTIAGILLLIGAVNISTEFQTASRGLSIGIMACLMIFAVFSCIISALFPVGETKQLDTFSAKIHGIGAVIGFFLLIVSSLLIGILLLRMNHMLMGTIAILSFLLAFTCYILLALSDKPQFSHTFIAWEGMWEHLCLLFSYLPVLWLSLWKLHESISPFPHQSSFS